MTVLVFEKFLFVLQSKLSNKTKRGDSVAEWFRVQILHPVLGSSGFNSSTALCKSHHWDS